MIKLGLVYEHRSRSWRYDGGRLRADEGDDRAVLLDAQGRPTGERLPYEDALARLRASVGVVQARG